MNYLTYQMATTRREELLRQAAQYRLVSHVEIASRGRRAEAAGLSHRRFSWASRAAARRQPRSQVHTPAG